MQSAMCYRTEDPSNRQWTRKILAPSLTGGPAQRGAALGTSLVILLVMTLIGVTALKNTSLQQQMATNQLVSNQAFQAAESGITRMIREETFILEEDDTIDDSGSIGGVPDTGEGANEADFESEADHTTKSAPGRGSRERIDSATVNSGCEKFHFEIVSEGSTDTTHASVAVHQGLYRLICGGAGTFVETSATL